MDNNLIKITEGFVNVDDQIILDHLLVKIHAKAWINYLRERLGLSPVDFNYKNKYELPFVEMVLEKAIIDIGEKNSYMIAIVDDATSDSTFVSYKIKKQSVLEKRETFKQCIANTLKYMFSATAEASFDQRGCFLMINDDGFLLNKNGLKKIINKTKSSTLYQLNDYLKIIALSNEDELMSSKQYSYKLRIPNKAFEDGLPYSIHRINCYDLSKKDSGKQSVNNLRLFLEANNIKYTPFKIKDKSNGILFDDQLLEFFYNHKNSQRAKAQQKKLDQKINENNKQSDVKVEKKIKFL